MSNIKTILLADDEPDIRIVAEMSLTQVGGWQTVLASNGREAIELAKQHQPDLILLDVMMPEVGGVAAIEALRSAAQTRDIPVIFMTAKVQKEEREFYTGLGAIGVIAKPFDPMQLPAQITKLLSQPRPQVRPPEPEPEPAKPERKLSKMELLRQRYADKLAQRLEELRDALSQARQASGEDRKPRIDAAYGIAHKLHGTAGTYGHEAVSTALGQVELGLQRLVDLEGEAAEACWSEIDGHFDASVAASQS